MAKSTAIVLAVGGITLFNRSVLQGKELDMRIPVATGIAGGAFALLERGNEKLVVGLAWIALITVVFARVDPKVPSPTETLLKYWNGR